ncbi:hypothetical protein CHELA40_12771 [Chelatococcus asaccharovorans]|nr:hypothetical protein CHELA40_12771 [Chelatococcus asaccharovorans]CAH1681702.1 hypothetical protein CHELA17_62849 [Chelatococcus asaccharovorans]
MTGTPDASSGSASCNLQRTQVFALLHRDTAPLTGEVHAGHENLEPAAS